MDKLSKDFIRNYKWIREHFGKLQSKYVNKWVAVDKGKVISSGDNPELVEKQAAKKVKKEDFPVVFLESGQNLY